LVKHGEPVGGREFCGAGVGSDECGHVIFTTWQLNYDSIVCFSPTDIDPNDP
jgi:hypothetical protein